ncbi:MAG: M20/M25/M40 family metallo-hydrolase, partial [Vicinamibacterales bacterium]
AGACPADAGTVTGRPTRRGIHVMSEPSHPCAGRRVSRRHHTVLGLAACLVAAGPASTLAQQPAAGAAVRESVERWVGRHQREVVKELADLLRIPNVAADRANIRRNAETLRGMLERRGFTAELLETDGNPLVWGELKVPGATRTLLLYAHYDGQPVDPANWKQGSPFEPILRDGRMEDGGKEVAGLGTLNEYKPDWRVYGRSASDDKSPIVATLAAVDAARASDLALTSNVRIVLDGEEEAGSPSLVPAIGKYRDRFTADAMIILDGPVHASGRPTVVYGARGSQAVQLTVYGPKFPLHSGHYGNWIPNPAMRLAELLATMKDEDGRARVEGYYDGIDPFTPEEQRMLDAVPDDPAALLALFGVAAPERQGLSLQEALQYPSLNIRGMASAFIGGDARTIIPDRAVAELDLRLVKETPADRQFDLLVAHIRKQGWHVVDADPDDATRAAFPKIVKVVRRGAGTNAYRTSPLLPISRQVAARLTATFGEPPVEIRTMGGTVPIAPFIDALGFPALSVPLVNFDNNQHAENENLRIGYFFRGITTLAALLTM